MNIKSLIYPAIIGLPFIDDSKWQIKLTTVSFKSGNCVRILCSNVYEFETVTGIKKKSVFNVKFYVSLDGAITAPWVLIASGEVTNPIHKKQAKDKLMTDFRRLFELNETKLRQQ